MALFRRYGFIACLLFLIAASPEIKDVEGTAPEAGVPVQPAVITSILSKESNLSTLNQLGELLGRIDSIYVNLYDNLNANGRITVFFDPAHGKIRNGYWEGEVTGRLSCTGLPEEYYSILLSRELYRLLSSNRHIEVKSTDDFMRVMQGKSDVYNNIPFSETVRLALNENAFIIVSEHLNNISSILKASGLMNIPGIHIINDRYGNRFLSYIYDTNRGFLTLYNKYDITGFSHRYSTNLREMLTARGLSANSWQMGAVPDDRFTYFVDFPISVIFESGFISNPEDEEMLRKPEYQKIIAESQYTGLIKTIAETFGVDISGKNPLKVKSPSPDMINLFKLSRIALFYIRNCEPNKAISVINLMDRNYGASCPTNIAPYRQIRTTLQTAEYYFATSKKMLNRKKYKNARRYVNLTRRTLRYKPLYSSLLARYRGSYAKMDLTMGDSTLNANERKLVPPENYPASSTLAVPARAALTTPIILPIESGQNLEAAIVNALDPDAETLPRLVKSFRNATVTSKVRVKSSTHKNGKKKYYWKNISEKVRFSNGIYIVYLNRSLVLTGVKRVNRVALNPALYQNQQYLKNSHFASHEKQRTL